MFRRVVRNIFNYWYGRTNLNGDNKNIRKLFLTTIRNIEVNITIISEKYTDKMV